MKHIRLILLFLLISAAGRAEHNPFDKWFEENSKLFNALDKGGVPSDFFEGQEVSFDFYDSRNLNNIILETPDTIWLKEKKPKKPKEGKHYRLVYNYKGILAGDKYVTPIDSFRNVKFIMVGLEALNEPESGRQTGYKIKLKDKLEGQKFDVIFDKTFTGPWKMTLPSLYSDLDGLKSGDYYLKKEIEDEAVPPYKLDETETYVEIGEPYHNFQAVNPFVVYTRFHLSNHRGKSFDLDYNSKFKKKSDIAFITKSEMDDILESRRVYTLNIEIMEEDLKPRLGKWQEEAIWGETKPYRSTISQTIQPGSSPLGSSFSLPSETYILIGDKLTVRGKDYYKAALDGKAFFIACEDVKLEEPDLLEKLMKEDQELRDLFFEYSKQGSLYFYSEHLKETLDEYNKIIKRPIAVLEFQVTDMSEYTEGTGLRFSVMNLSKKSIKYITINYVGYNRVDDPVYPFYGQAMITNRCIGPIEYGEALTYEFDYVWFTDIVDYAELKSMTVEYRDGTKKKFTGDVLEPVGDFVEDFSEEVKSLVENLPPVRPSDDTSE